jgi:hypothetical protein
VARLDPALDQSGTWTIVAREGGDNDTLNYAVTFECIAGDCGGPPPLGMCDIRMSQDIYTVGDMVTVETWRFANQGPDPMAVEIKNWLSIPGFDPAPVINAGADGSLILPPGFDTNFGPVDLFTVTGDFPLGRYEFSCRLLDPVTGELKAVDLNPFDIQ